MKTAGAVTATRPALVVAALCGLALAGLAVWSVLPDGHRSDTVAGVGLFLAMWLAMVTAMMVPTAVPMVLAVTRLARDARQAALLPVALTAGYLGVWLLAGTAALAVQALIGLAPSHDMPGMEHVAGWGPGLVLLAAGAFGLSPLAERCVHACRRPAGFVAARWPGAGPTRSAARIGVDYGMSCLGCCAALMAAIVVVGMASVAWMVGFGVVMAVQKNTRHGIWISRIAACALLLAGVAVIGHP